MLWGHDEYCAAVQHERKIEGRGKKHRKKPLLHECVDTLPVLLSLELSSGFWHPFAEVMPQGLLFHAFVEN